MPEYWVVRPANRDVLVCSRPDGDLRDFAETRLFGYDDEIVSPTLPIRLPAANLFKPPFA